MTTQKQPTANAIEGFVNFLDAPNWTPGHVHGYNHSKDMSQFRRCIPLTALSGAGVGYGDEAVFYGDGTPDLNNGRPFSILRIEDDLPEYHNIKRVRRLPPHVTCLPGEWYSLAQSANTKHLGITNDRRLIVIKEYVRFRAGKFQLMPQSGGEGLGQPNHHLDKECAEWAAERCGFMFAASLAYRYLASMEIEAGNGTSTSIPLNLGQLREVLRDRDKPESGSRRPALVHLVRQHNRNYEKDELVKVREHLRGKIECHWRGWDVVLRPSDYDVDRLTTHV